MRNSWNHALEMGYNIKLICLIFVSIKEKDKNVQLKKKKKKTRKIYGKYVGCSVFPVLVLV